MDTNIETTIIRHRAASFTLEPWMGKLGTATTIDTLDGVHRTMMFLLEASFTVSRFRSLRIVCN